MQRRKCIACGKRWFDATQPKSSRLATDAVEPKTSNPKTFKLESDKPKSTKAENRKPSTRPKIVPTGLESSTPQLTEAIQLEAIRQHKAEIRSPTTTATHLRIETQLEQLAQAKRFSESLGNEFLDLFANALEANIKPITTVVHDAIAKALGFPTVLVGRPVAPTRTQSEQTQQSPSDEEDLSALKTRLRKLERANHTLRNESIVLTNQAIDVTAARQQAEARCRIAMEERDDLKSLASELEQSRKALKFELLEVRQRATTLAVEVRRDGSADQKSSPPTPAVPTVNPEPTPRPEGGQSVGNRISPPTLTVAERQEIERLASTLMATLTRLEGYKIRTADIAAVTGIASGWKRVIEHLITLGQVVHQNEFLRISDLEKIRRHLK